MEQQATEVLELIKNGMAEIPQIGGEAWNLYVSGIRTSGIINISIYLLIVMIVIAISYFIYKISSKGNDIAKDDAKNKAEKDTVDDFYMRSYNGVHPHYHYESDDGSDSLMMFLIGLIAVMFVIFCCAFFSSLGENITKIVSPEYYLINDIIKALR